MKIFLTVLGFSLFVLIAALAYLNGYIHHKGPLSDHFDGKRFHNQAATTNKSLLTVLYWRLTGNHAVWPKKVEPSKHYTLPQPKKDAVIVTFINHASCLIQTGNITILTDPQYNDIASPLSWIGPRRVHEPGIAYEDLPPIDIVIISHDHYDHMDEKTLKLLKYNHDPLFLVGLGNDIHLASFGIKEKVYVLDWFQPFDFKDTQIIFTPAQHFSGRGLFDRNASLWGGYIVNAKNTKLFFAGDTGYGPHFKEIYDKFGPMDLSMIPIGSYLPRWFMKPMHVNPEEAVLAHIDLQSKKSIGIHFKTFQLSDEDYEQPIADLESAKIKYGLSDDSFVAPQFGESFIVRQNK